MIEFTQEEFDGMDIDGVDVGAGRCLLTMMVCVYVFVDGLEVEEPVEEGVGEVVDYEKCREGQKGVCLCELSVCCCIELVKMQT